VLIDWSRDSRRLLFSDGNPPGLLIEAETQGAAQGAALKAARDRFYKGDIAREMATFAQENGGLMRYEDFASYSGGGTRLVRLSWLCRT
jgi:gamma-glutamyltranspeptidase